MVKKYVEFATIVALSILSCGLILPTLAAADLPDARVYEVKPDRSNKKNHETAIVIVAERLFDNVTDYVLAFSPKKGKFKDQAFLCEDAKDNGDDSFQCVREGKYRHEKKVYKVQETFTVGGIAGDFCKDLRSKTSPNWPKAVMLEKDCPRGRSCMCYDLKLLCWDKAAKKYADTCPDFDPDGKNAQGDVLIRVPPGRGAGSGVSN